MRTIGILGGFGPDATLTLEHEILLESRRLLPARFNQGYPPVVTVHIRHPPILLEDGKPPEGPLRIDPRVLEAARRLGAWADLLLIGANTPHLFEDEIRDASGCEVVSMVDVTVDAIRAARRAAQVPGEIPVPPVGLLGLGVPAAFVRRFEADHVAFIPAGDEVRRTLDEAIYRTLEEGVVEARRPAAVAAVDWLRAGGAFPIVLGCTEIPLLLGERANAPDLIDPGRLAARVAVRRAIDGAGVEKT